MKVQLDGSLMTDKTALHDQIQEKLGFPEYYGRNLDALYDMLTSLPESTVIDLRGKDIMLEQLGAYGAALLVTLQQAEQNAPNLSLNIL